MFSKVIRVKHEEWCYNGSSKNVRDRIDRGRKKEYRRKLKELTQKELHDYYEETKNGGK